MMTLEPLARSIPSSQLRKLGTSWLSADNYGSRGKTSAFVFDGHRPVGERRIKRAVRPKKNMTDMCVHWLHRHPFPCRIRFSYRNAAFLVCSFNIVIAILLFQAFFGSSSRRMAISRKSSVHMTEAEAIRRAMVPFQLIKRIKEIQSEATTEIEVPMGDAGQQQSAASDLSKRLKDFQALNDANSKKALEEWRQRKMDRLRKKREIEKNASITVQT